MSASAARTRPRRRRGRRVLILLGIPLLAVAAALLLAATFAPTAALANWGVRAVSEHLMGFEPLPDDLRELAVRSKITDRHGEQIALVRDENRILVELDDVPDVVGEAVVATEDREFHEHEGVNWSAIARAGWDNVQAGGITAGASTITQQLVKNTVITEGDEVAEQTLRRKIQEAAYAVQLEERMAKDDILEQYLNTAYFGNGVYGVGTAAEFYWATDVSELEAEHAALLAGMLRAPEHNNPITNEDAALQRRSVVLAQMAEEDYLDEEEARELADRDLDLEVQETPAGAGSGDMIVDLAIEVLEGEGALGNTPEERFNTLATGGLEVRLTIDQEVQELAEETIAEHLVEDDTPHGALSAVDSRTGEVYAAAHGPHDYEDFRDDFGSPVAAEHLGNEGRQTGSTFKALGLAAALEQGLPPTLELDTATQYTAEDQCVQAGSDEWTVGNFAGAAGGELDMFEATTISSNTYFVELLDQHLGIEPLRDVSDRLGLRRGPGCAAVLGSDSQGVMEMAAAFATFANEGRRCDPHVVAEVRDRNGDVLVDNTEGECSDRLDADVANQVTELLRGPVDEGTAAPTAQIGRPAAGKTGTTDQFGDAWFVGYVPQLSAAMWMGEVRRDDQGEIVSLSHPDCPGGVTGGCVPTTAWASFMGQAVDLLDLEAQDFPEPPELPETEVPSVVGEDEDDAVEILDEAAFESDTETVEDWRPAGEVIDQSPEGGTEAYEGSVVDLTVSDGTGAEPGLPDLTGLSENAALDVLQEFVDDVGVEVSVQTRGVPAAFEGQIGEVTGQSPGAGTLMDDGDQVVLDIGEPAEQFAPDTLRDFFGDDPPGELEDLFDEVFGDDEADEPSEDDDADAGEPDEDADADDGNGEPPEDDAGDDADANDNGNNANDNGDNANDNGDNEDNGNDDGTNGANANGNGGEDDEDEEAEEEGEEGDDADDEEE